METTSPANSRIEKNQLQGKICSRVLANFEVGAIYAGESTKLLMRSKPQNTV
jgi:hypothetical protein